MMTLGCPKNRVDSEGMLGSLSKAGYNLVPEASDAEVIVVNTCAFIIIPKLRGAQRSRPIDDVVAEAARLADGGVQELNLVAQDLTAYGHDLPGRPKLHELLQQLVKVDVRWIRLHYAYPRVF